MPSASYRRWAGPRSRTLDEIEQAHATVSGSGPGWRQLARQINNAYAVLLAAEFQVFCRDIHEECVRHIVNSITPRESRVVIEQEFMRNRSLDRGNASPSTLGVDFGRLDLQFWPAMDTQDRRSRERRSRLESLNTWRNAIVHQDFDRATPGGARFLSLRRVRLWRATCGGLARSMDRVLRAHVQSVVLTAPWQPGG